MEALVPFIVRAYIHYNVDLSRLIIFISCGLLLLVLVCGVSFAHWKLIAGESIIGTCLTTSTRCHMYVNSI